MREIALNLAHPACPYETATSYASRLARFARAADPFDLCLDVGLDWKSVVRGDPISIRRLAARGGTSADVLERWSIRAMGPLRFRIGGDVVPNKTLLRSRLRVCPACILEDLASGGLRRAYRRMHWNLQAIRTCERHWRPLLKLPWLEHTFGNYDIVARVEATMPLIENAAGKDDARPFTDYERYILDRLHGLQAIPYLDTMPLAFVIRFAEALGLTRIWYRDAARDADDDLLYEAGAAGFDVLRNGHEAFIAELHRLQIDPLQSNASHKLDLGPFWVWLRCGGNGDGMAALRAVVREHVFRNYPVEAGTMVLGQACPRTQVYSINSAKRAFRISRARLNAKLVAAGLAAPNGSPDRVTLLRPLRAEDLAPRLAPTAGLLSREEAKARLGASESIFRQLRLADLIRRHTEPTDRRPRYAAAEIETFLSDVKSAISTRASFHPSADRMSLVEACRKIGTPLLTVQALIQDGKVPSSAIDPTMQGLAAIHVDIEEVRTAVTGELLDAVPKLKTAKILGGSLRMVDFLLSTGELALEKRGPALRGHTMPAVTRASIDSFLTDHTTLGRLSQATGLSFQRLRFELPKLKILPRQVPKDTGHIYTKAGLRDVILTSDLELPGPLDWGRM
ncbi:TniQ family protein [Palleronia sp. LCG004]|uniref:TniQ family protein n=1 Tax=Palleronia sp. LCG004 TaxID=3079304 RepID=UPI002943B0A8|nr:TniQ family protein [Palleronia sp. LCG004]WOI56703.1 TniQ family protein [Palleronia sp. LCG004]